MRALRIAAVTAGLMVAGAVFGAIAGVATLAAWAIADEGLRSVFQDLNLYLFGSVVGGLFGAVLGPIAAWLLMRHVPLGLAVGGTTLGTVAGAVIGLLVGDVVVSFYAGFAGFAFSAIYLRLCVPREPRPLRGGFAAGRLNAGGG